MRIRHIEVFHAVYSSGSVTQAARLLNVSQPSVSKVLAHAELQLGFDLFKRVKGRLTPTPEAERLYEHVDRLFDEIGSVRRIADNLRDLGEGKIRVASTPAIGMELVPNVVASYNATHPGVYFEIETLHYTEIVTALLESRIDIALAFDPPTHPSITEHAIGTGRFMFIQPPDFDVKIKQPVALSDLNELPFIRLNNRGPLGQLLDNYLEANDTHFNVVAATETYHIAKALVSHGLGVSIVDEITANSTPHLPVSVAVLEIPLVFRVCILHLQNIAMSQLTSSFIEHTTREISSLLAQNKPHNIGL